MQTPNRPPRRFAAFAYVTTLDDTRGCVDYPTDHDWRDGSWTYLVRTVDRNGWFAGYRRYAEHELEEAR